MTFRPNTYDVIVVGAGHAGCEAALAAARMGCRVLLMAIDLDKLAAMPCSPSIGGMAKGQLVKEIDALGGEMAKITDQTAIQYRTLNTKKGRRSAPRAPRTTKNATHGHEAGDRDPAGLDLKQALVERLAVESGRVVGWRSYRIRLCRPRRRAGHGHFPKRRVHIGFRSIPADGPVSSPPTAFRPTCKRSDSSWDASRPEHRPGSIAPASISRNSRLRAATIVRCRFRCSPGDRSCRSCPVSSATPSKGRMPSCAATCRARRSTAASSPAPRPAIARPSRTKSSNSPRRNGIRSFSSRRASTRGDLRQRSREQSAPGGADRGGAIRARPGVRRDHAAGLRHRVRLC